MGTTPVVCTATDSQWNSASASFIVYVKDAREQLNELFDLVVSEAVGPGTSLAKQLEAARAVLDAGNELSTCRILRAFFIEARAQLGEGTNKRTGGRTDGGGESDPGGPQLRDVNRRTALGATVGGERSRLLLGYSLG
jgi:hypothetical protein